MSRRPILALLAALVALGSVAPADAAPSKPRLSALSSAKFPDRAFVLSLPDKRRLTAGDLTVRENGRDVSAGTLVPADRLGAAGFSTVLVIDSSISMRGEPIAAAMRAARAFAVRRREDQRLGVVSFNGRPTIVLPTTADAARIDAALAEPPRLGPRTAIRDATVTAVRMLQADRVTGGAVVVLSDGADTGSRIALDGAVAAARKAGVRVYGVGLESGAFDPGTLQMLSNATGGAYTTATSSRRLERIFDRLGAELSNQYLLRYRSLAGPQERVQVEAVVPGYALAATAAYTTPALQSVALEPYRRGFLDSLLGSPAAVVLVAVLCAVLVGVGVLVVLRYRGNGVLDRVGQFVPHAVEELSVDPRFALDGGKKRRPLFAAEWIRRLREDLDVAKIDMPVERLLLITGLGTVTGMWVFAAASGTGGAALLGLTVPLCARAVIQIKAGRQRREFADQLPDNIQIVASAMRAGQSFVGALAILLDEAAEPSKGEFARAVHDERLGMPIEEALSKVAKRMRSEELEYVGLVARLQSETGGNTADVLDRLVETLRARAELRRLVRTLTSQGRLASYVIGALPLVILAAVTVLNRDYANTLYATPVGHAMLVISGLLLALGSYVLRRIVDIKV